MSGLWPALSEIDSKNSDESLVRVKLCVRSSALGAPGTPGLAAAYALLRKGKRGHMRSDGAEATASDFKSQILKRWLAPLSH
jgi:hypothetical protein